MRMTARTVRTVRTARTTLHAQYVHDWFDYARACMYEVIALLINKSDMPLSCEVGFIYW